MTDENLTCGRCKTPYEIDEEHVIFKKGKMAYIRCIFCNQVRRVAWNVVEHLKPISVEEEKRVISEHVKPIEHVKKPVKSSTEARKITPPNESSKKEKTSELNSVSVPLEAAGASSQEDRKETLENSRIDTSTVKGSVLPGKDIKDRDPDRKTHEIVKTLSGDTSESDMEVNPKREGSETSEPHNDSGDSGSGWGWFLGGIASFAGVILLGRALK